METKNLTAPRIALIAALTIVVLTVVPAALAGKGTGGGGKQHGGGTTSGGSSSLTVKMVTDANQNGLPNWNDTITFNVSTTATTEPHVNVTCYQNATTVYGAATGYYASYPWPWTQNMNLSSQSWTGGAANCTAVLQAYSGTSVTTLSTMNFSVAT